MSSYQITQNEVHTKVLIQGRCCGLSCRAGHRRSRALAVDKVSVVAHLHRWWWWWCELKLVEAYLWLKIIWKSLKKRKNPRTKSPCIASNKFCSRFPTWQWGTPAWQSSQSVVMSSQEESSQQVNLQLRNILVSQPSLSLSTMVDLQQHAELTLLT